MTERHNIWLMRDESAQQRHGAIRADTITGITTMEHAGYHLLSATLAGGGNSVTLGTCLSEYRDHIVNGLLSTLVQAERSEAHFVVIEAIPRDHQDGPDQNFWSVYENEWPVPRAPAPAASGGW